jgi:hypothetical protein
MFDETMASRLTSNSTVILPIMMDLLHGKLTDDELTLQLLYFLHGCMSHQGSRLTDWIVQQQQQSDTLQLLLDLWRDDQPAIRGRAESILDLLEQQLLLSKTQQQSAGNSGDNLRPDSGPHSRQQLLSRLRYGRFLWTNYQWAQKTHRDIMHEYSDDTQLLLEIDQCFPGGIVGGKRNSSTAARGYRSGTESRVNEYYNDGGNDGEELSHYHWNTEGVYFTEH